MRMTSGMSLGFALVVLALGCGSKTSPEPQPAVPIQPETPTAPTAKPVHELDLSKHVIPTQPVAGPVGGVEIAPQALIEGEYLVFRVTKPGTSEVEREVLLKIRSSATDHLPEG